MASTSSSAAEIGGLLRSRAISATEVAQEHLDRIGSLDPKIGCFLTVDAEGALSAARAAQERVDAGDTGPLVGVPVVLKDNISTAGLKTTCGSRILENYVPTFDATVVERLRNAGAIILGKANLDEFAMGTSTEFSAFHVTRNPWDLERSPGGSSGGSAAAVCAGLTPLALGSDTGGSIRQPAALCGIVGMKPTYGRCSRYGLVAFGSSLDQIGPFARTVEDAALLASTITGHDPRDSTSHPTQPIDVSGVRSGSLKGKKIGLPTELFPADLHAGVRREVEATIDALSREGAEFVKLSLPAISYGVTTYYIIAPAEASSNLARFDGVRYGLRVEADNPISMTEKTRAKGFGHEVKSRIMIGTYALSAGYYDAFYVRAQQVRSRMRAEFEKAFTEVDFLLSPTSPTPAFKLGELKDDPLALKLLDYCTIPANMNGMPAISLNCGFDNGLPIGIQLMAAPFQDEALLQGAYCVEQIVGATRMPPLT